MWQLPTLFGHPSALSIEPSERQKSTHKRIYTILRAFVVEIQILNRFIFEYCSPQSEGFSAL